MSLSRLAEVSGSVACSLIRLLILAMARRRKAECLEDEVVLERLSRCVGLERGMV